MRATAEGVRAVTHGKLRRRDSEPIMYVGFVFAVLWAASVVFVRFYFYHDDPAGLLRYWLKEVGLRVPLAWALCVAIAYFQVGSGGYPNGLTKRMALVPPFFLGWLNLLGSYPRRELYPTWVAETHVAHLVVLSTAASFALRYLRLRAA